MDILTILTLTLAITTTATAQYSALCGSNPSNANASGVFTYPVSISDVPPASWALTVDTLEDGSANSNIWYSTGGQDYSDDLSLGYDVCAFFIDNLPINTVRLSQTAGDDCSGMFTDRCIDTLLTRAQESAFGYVQTFTPPPYSNLSAGVLPTLCSLIATDLSGGEGTTWPHECQKEAGEQTDSASGYVGATITSVGTNSVHLDENCMQLIISALTGYNESSLDSDCELQSGTRSWQLADNVTSSSDEYDNATLSVYPILSVYFPVANHERTESFGYAASHLACLRAKEYSQGSRVSPELPAGTPYHYGSALRGCGIAGVAVGVLAFVSIISGLAVW